MMNLGINVANTICAETLSTSWLTVSLNTEISTVWSTKCMIRWKVNDADKR